MSVEFCSTNSQLETMLNESLKGAKKLSKKKGKY